MTHPVEGIHLVRTAENLDEIAAAVDRFGPPVGLGHLLADLNRQATPVKASGRAPSSAFTWEPRDAKDNSWWPQGITTSADAEESGEIDGRRLLVTSWYSKGVAGDNQGSRITVVDLDTLAYRHVLLVTPAYDLLNRADLAPLRIHAGGLVWFDHYLHVAATRKGLYTFNFDDLMKIDADDDTYGYRYVLPARFGYQAFAEGEHEQLRYSFLSVDRSATPPELVAGEYGVSDMTTRLIRFEIDPTTYLLNAGDDGVTRPLALHNGGVGHMQGAAVVQGTYYVTSSAGRWRLGSMYVGRPGAFKRNRWMLPPGPEDITYWPARDEFWCLTEYPGRRYVFSMPRNRFSA